MAGLGSWIICADFWQGQKYDYLPQITYPRRLSGSFLGNVHQVYPFNGLILPRKATSRNLNDEF